MQFQSFVRHCIEKPSPNSPFWQTHPGESGSDLYLVFKLLNFKKLPKFYIFFKLNKTDFIELVQLAFPPSSTLEAKATHLKSVPLNIFLELPDNKTILVLDTQMEQLSLHDSSGPTTESVRKEGAGILEYQV